jgi:hypothetical protein
MRGYIGLLESDIGLMAGYSGLKQFGYKEMGKLRKKGAYKRKPVKQVFKSYADIIIDTLRPDRWGYVRK